MSNLMHIRLAWAVMITFALLDAIGLHLSGIAVKPQAVGATLFHILCMVLLSLFYTHWRKDQRIALLAHSIALFFAFTAVTMVMSYLTLALKRPLVDEPLVAIDRAMGLDWKAAYDWVAAHPILYKTLFYAYISLIPQMIVLIIVTNFHAMYPRLWELLWLFISACVICLVCSALWPAAGAFGYFGMQDQHTYVQAFYKAWNGEVRMIGEDSVEGIIQFPSLHVALGIIYTYIARGMRRIFPVLVVLNILLVIASQSIGGHHFVDLWAGALMAGGLIAISHKLSRKAA